MRILHDFLAKTVKLLGPYSNFSIGEAITQVYRNLGMTLSWKIAFSAGRPDNIKTVNLAFALNPDAPGHVLPKNIIFVKNARRDATNIGQERAVRAGRHY